MPFLDLEASYRASLAAGENPFLPYDLHPNAVGMRIAADALYETVWNRFPTALRLASDAAR